jgi:hypothetical protein
MKKIIAVIAFAAAPFLFGQQKVSEAANISANKTEKISEKSLEEAKLAEIKAEKEKKIAEEKMNKQTDGQNIKALRTESAKADKKSANSLKD